MVCGDWWSNQDVCTGCQACVTACAMENNIPWVGEDDAAYGRQMSWIRVERLWEGEYPEVSIDTFPADHVPALRESALRAGLPGVRHGAQQFGTDQPSGL